MKPRPISFETEVNPYALGSVIANFGNTKVHITVNIEESVPRFIKQNNLKHGWLSAEYSMLPGATHERGKRDRKSVSGRTQEIQRLIARSLRSCVDLELLGERTILVDCDVLVADGGTRTTAISGAYVALKLALDKLLTQGKIEKMPLLEQIAAVSVGVAKNKEIVVDLNYEQDSSCHTDMNLVMNSQGHFIEIQGTAEGEAFSGDELQKMLEYGKSAIEIIFSQQNQVLN